LTYDAAGNLTAEPGKTYQYDAENRLTSINSGAVATYTYNAAGQRVQKIIGNTTYTYYYDLAGNVVAEWYGTPGGYNGWGKGYVYLGGQLVAQYADSTTYFVHKDHLGSTRLLTKLDQSVQETLDFLPYGEQLNSTSTTTHKFTGKERDSESDLDYFGARYYVSTNGRFLNADLPFIDQHAENPQSWSLYAFVRSNPLNLLDKSGRDASPLIWVATFEQFAYWLVHTSSLLDLLTAGKLSRSGRGAGVAAKGNIGVWTKRADDITDTHGGGENASFTIHMWKRLKPTRFRSYFVTFSEIQTNTYDIQNGVKVCVSCGTKLVATVTMREEDAGPPVISNSRDTGDIVTTFGSYPGGWKLRTSNLNSFSKEQLSAIKNDATHKGYSELAYEVQVEEGRRRLAEKEKEKKEEVEGMHRR
jgi:RHS repeat-associated protein